MFNVTTPRGVIRVERITLLSDLIETLGGALIFAAANGMRTHRDHTIQLAERLRDIAGDVYQDAWGPIVSTPRSRLNRQIVDAEIRRQLETAPTAPARIRFRQRAPDAREEEVARQQYEWRNLVSPATWATSAQFSVAGTEIPTAPQVAEPTALPTPEAEIRDFDRMLQQMYDEAAIRDNER